MRTVEKRVYQFDELSAKAKEKARDWFRDLERESFGSHGDIYEPYETAAKLLAIEFARNEVPLMGGGKRSEPRIWWGLSYSQSGHSASWEGTYQYAKGCVKAVKQEFPTDKALHNIATALYELQRKHGYALRAKVSSGRGVEKWNMKIEEVTIGDRQSWDTEIGLEQEVLEIMKDFAQWIFDGILADYEARLENEVVDASIEANEYEFNEDGTFYRE